MTKLTTRGEKDSANTDLPQFHDPDDQVIGLDDETDIQNDPETETIEIDPEEAAVLAYFTNARRNQLEAFPEPTKRDLQREEQIWAEPEDNLTSLDDPVRVYLREIGRIPLIDAKQEQYLARRIEEMAHLHPIPGLGRVHTNSAEMLSSRHGDYRSTVRTHSAGPAGSARQRQTAELAGAQRDPVCRRAGLQVARAVAPLRQLAYRLHTDEPLVEEWGARPGV